MTQRPHKRLKVWQKAMDLVETSYRMTENFPHNEQYGLVTQMRRAAVSISANIAEGAARQTSKETMQFYFIARGSLSELDTLTELGNRIGVLSASDHGMLIERIAEVSGLLQGLIGYIQRLPKKTAVTQSPNHLITQSRS